MKMALCTTKAKLETSQSADSVALLGHPSTDLESETVIQHAVIGTYALQENDTESQIRLGSAELVRTKRMLQSDNSDYSFSIDTNAILQLPAVLDLVTDPDPLNSKSALYAACADGALIRLSAQNSYTSLQRHDFEPTKKTPSVLNLSVHAAYDVITSSTLVASSDSSGYICTRRVTPNKDMDLLENRHAHDLEAWTVHITNVNSRPMILSGGDDGLFGAFMLNDPSPCWRLKSAHGGVGVTCIATPPENSNEIWTGGYDDHVRVWDIRNMKRCMDECNVSGGVWRIRFHPENPELILLAVMYEGFKTVRRNSNGLTISGHYKDHSSIAYGAEWVPSLETRDIRVALTASFYDRAVRLWTHHNCDNI